jgi:hypothetical protein
MSMVEYKRELVLINFRYYSLTQLFLRPFASIFRTVVTKGVETQAGL